jgi:thymidine phosphorylase
VVVILGGGRRRAEDVVNPAVGLSQILSIGDEAGGDRPLAVVHARNEAEAASAVSAVRNAFTIETEPPERPRSVFETVHGERRNEY